MEAKDLFFREAYSNGDEERAFWEKEVAELSKEVYGIDVFDKIIKKAEEVELKQSNSILIEQIIQNFLDKETDDDIKRIIKNCWAGNWDSPEFRNAQVQTKPYYDNSHLIRITTELEIEIGRISELFSDVLYLYMIQCGKIGEDNLRVVAELSLTHAKNIIDDTDFAVMQGVERIPEKFRFIYQTGAWSVYMAGLAFVLFHEIGHVLELECDIAKKYNITPSYSSSVQKERRLQAEWNADLIGALAVEKLYFDAEATRWMSACGILIVFVALAVGKDNLTKEKNHPALSKRLIKLKTIVFSWLDDNEIQLVKFHLETICDLLQKGNAWRDHDWWKG